MNRTFGLIAFVTVGMATFSSPLLAGEVADDSQQKCLELTRIAADSMRLTPADERWCLTFGKAVEMNNAGRPPDPDHGRPAKMSHDQLAALIAKFISQNPKYANEPLAAKTMYAFSALFSGEMR